MRRARLDCRIGEALGLDITVVWASNSPVLFITSPKVLRHEPRTKAAQYALLAAGRASDQLAFEEAAEYLHRGLVALASSPPPMKAFARIRSWRWRGASSRLFDVHSVKQLAEQAADAARAVGSPERLGRAAVLRSCNITMGRPDPAAIEYVQ